MKKPCFRWRAVAILAAGLAVAAGARAEETDPDGRRYLPSDDPVADVESALGRAAATGRRALVVLGANWCHDSRALAARLHRAPLAGLVERHYAPVFVDVGYLERGRAVTRRFGVPIYYATPTVLIIDPASSQVLNEGDRHQWGNASSIGMQQTVQYFEYWSQAVPPDPAPGGSAELQRLYAQVDLLERRLAERVAAGYAVVGPMLAAYKAGDAPEDFESRWDELLRFRAAIPGDLSALREEARRRVAAGEDGIRLAWPEYPTLSWENPAP